MAKSFLTPAQVSWMELLNRQIEELVVEAKRLLIDVDEVTAAIEKHWQRLSQHEEAHG
ncbi:hypothetical protein AB4Y89_00900 [Terriglobus sp. 2YAB30_2]